MAVVYLYLATQETLVHLTKQIAFERVPVASDWLRIDVGGIFPHQVSEVTFDTDGTAKVALGIPKERDGRWSHIESEQHLDQLIAELVSGGWLLGARKPNRLYRN